MRIWTEVRPDLAGAREVWGKVHRKVERTLPSQTWGLLVIFFWISQHFFRFLNIFLDFSTSKGRRSLPGLGLQIRRLPTTSILSHSTAHSTTLLSHSTAYSTAMEAIWKRYISLLHMHKLYNIYCKILYCALCKRISVLEDVADTSHGL